MHIKTLLVSTLMAALVRPVAADPLKPVEGDGFVSAGDAVTWRVAPLTTPAGGGKFAGSAFFHPLRTPSGFELSQLQPKDHLHHFGLWWPWKFIEVNGKQHNTWEIQEGQGAHEAVSAELLPSDDGAVRWKLKNRFVTKDGGKVSGTAIEESTMVFVRRENDSHVIDIEIRQQAAGSPVKIVEYRYSGFSWRGTSAWNKDNSLMLTSAGRHRDDANGTHARWVVVSGDAGAGKASMLMMSAAVEISGTEERIRVWDSNAENGAPFVNFNPVMDKPLALEAGNKAVSHRKYRIIAADHAIDAAEAEAAWKRFAKTVER